MSTVITDDWLAGWDNQQQQQGPQLDLDSDGGTPLGAPAVLDLFSDDDRRYRDDE
jgi:hypothetical protein